MTVTFDGDRAHGGSEARERFYDSRGYGRPRDGGIELAPVEVAHLLFRGDIDSVRDRRSGTDRRLGFASFLASKAVSEVAFFVYKELRDRGFYLSPTRWVENGTGEFVVYPRGDGPWDGTAAYRVWARGERAGVTARQLRSIANPDANGENRPAGTGTAAGESASDPTGVLAVVDEESEVTYLEVSEPTVTGSTHHEFPSFDGTLLSDRVLALDPPPALHDRAFYGQRLDRDRQAVQLSLVEAAYLAECKLLTVDADGRGVVARGRAVEGDRFDRRLRAYSALRTAGLVPKTGFKFGADFRTYADVDSVEDLGHSELLVRVLPADHTFAPRDLSLDVRLAHGVRKRLVLALTDVDPGIDWLAVERLTP